ncbi:hypothetical protein PACTADRAFT_37171 [Pachysolen tannophilus NRRL Y-2460]|uniref:AP complex subunit beta n=1 Tax=Pachysolen tannophilus NRRL Y-2460 TaxID=669874 RepID=A0A1E4U0H6_PACTA|nr:hypothetical protein PACTADRAFT_37171 [Pachysolen tannophilus NRRL Y-2460]
MTSLEKRLKKIFGAPRKGETFELRSGLVSQYADERKDSIKRVIAAMTVGKDVSSLFPDVLKNISTHDLEQKKLVYLYLMNYAKTNPELCILAVNTFVQDTEDPNPLVRALAIRTMGCIRVDKIVDYMEIPLNRTLTDDNPYVRKTAAICVAKLFDLNKEICLENGFLDILLKLVDDSNPMVVANAISALLEIQSSNTNDFLGGKFLKIDDKILKKLLMTLNECTEWGRITILTALSEFTSTSSEDASHIIDRVTPQLQHENPAVVLASIKTILKHFENLQSKAQTEAILKKLSAPLISLLSTPPEIQYVALRNIRIILEKYPNLLSRELRVFFVKYNDPAYLKLEKIEILVRLSNDANAALLLSELKEYSMEIDTDFVKRSVRAIGQVAIKLQKSSKLAVDILYDLLTTRTSYVINEGIIVLQNILRRYPEAFVTTIIPIIADLSIDDLDEPESISSYVWIVGQYCKSIPHLDLKLQQIISNYYDIDPAIQLAILSCIVKINLVKPSKDSQQYLQTILNLSTQQVEDADVRDKSYIYWRMLSANDSELSKSIILKKLPILNSTIEKIPTTLLNELIDELSTLSSVYHEPSEMFIEADAKAKSKNYILDTKENSKIEDLQRMAKNEIVNNAVKAENLLDFDDDDEYEGFDDANSSSNTNHTGNNNNNGVSSNVDVLDELNDLFAGLSSGPTVATNNNNNNNNNNINNNNTINFNNAGGNDTTKKTNEDLLSLF